MIVSSSSSTPSPSSLLSLFIQPCSFPSLFRKRRKKVSIRDTEVGPNPNPGQSKPHIPLDKSDWLENWSVPQAGLSPDCKIEADIMVSCYSDKGLKIWDGHFPSHVEDIWLHRRIWGKETVKQNLEGHAQRARARESEKRTQGEQRESQRNKRYKLRK